MKNITKLTREDKGLTTRNIELVIGTNTKNTFVGTTVNVPKQPIIIYNVLTF